jgi:drug/metabolite transporter (DMT)-like permease
MIGIIFALSASLSWGAGDFCGGIATRKINQFQVLLLTTSSSLLLLILFAVIGKESMPSAGDIVLAVIAGICGALGLAALYKGLSLGNTALVAPVAGVIGAIIPTLAGIAVEGLPGFLTMTGFVLAIASIWLLSRPKDGSSHLAADGLGLAIIAGFGFGGFLALIAQIQGEQVFTPLVFSKIASLVFAILLIRIGRQALPKPGVSPVALLSGFLDAGGNILYLFAAQNTRLDIAALLSSLYPAATVLLSSLILKEKISLPQWIGVSACVVAIMLITSGQ